MVRIDNRTERPLSVPEKEVLEALFAGHDELIIKSEFNSGLTDSRVFLVRSVRSDGPELPSVVKIDHFERIQREWEAYQGCIRYRVPRVAEVRDQPVYPPGNPYGGLWYPLAEAGAADVQSLYDYLQRESIENCCKVLETQLFKSLENIWQHRKVRPEFHFQSSYDAFLPVNLFIEQGALQPEARVVHLYPDIVRERVVKAGDTVQLSGFRVVKLYRQEQRLSLDTPQDHPAAYRMHIQPVDNVTQYKVGQVVHEPFTGIVKKTRHDQLLKQAQKALGSGIDLKSQTLTLPNSISVPNPLVALPQTLNHSLDANIACIHGDLNLQNVLVNPENHTIYLIDFAKSGRDHVLRDLLQLEMSVVTTILAQALVQAMLAPEQVCSFYQSLHEEIYAEKTVLAPAGLEKPFAILKSIRRAAQPYLFKPRNWAEYYRGLTIYLIGALKFESLDEQPVAAWRPKQVAFWGAATIQKLLEWEPTSKDNDTRNPDPDKQPEAEGINQDNPVQIDMRSGGNYFEGTGPVTVHGDVIGGSKTETYFHGPVSGPVHTGTGNINVRSDKEKAQQQVVRLRLDAAVPEQAFAERTFDVAVAIRQPESPVLTEDTLAKRQSGDVLTAWPTSSPYVRLQIQLSAPECTIHGADNRAFRLYQAQDSPVFYFQLTARKLGEISLIMTVYQEDNWVGSGRVRTRVQEQIVGQVKTRITSYAVEKRARLRQILTNYFDESELRNLSFDLGVDYENLPGAAKGDKARELVAYFERRDRLAELVQACHGIRPDASWWDTFNKV